VIVNQRVADALGSGTVLKNGDTITVEGIEIVAVPAYNLVHKRPSGDPFHAKGDGNGYVLSFGGTRVYIAGDTENVPEMKALDDIGIAFLPMNLPYTMSPEMVADAATAFRPRILYPYHYGNTDVSRVVALLENEKDIEVRVRDMK
jgi:L-ascorbate metabolism protein UlaG (beta-lactamase superfamily)